MAPREPARLSPLENHRAASRTRRACTRPPPPPPPAGRNPRRRDRAAPRAAEARAPRTRRWGRASGRSDACAALFSRCARIDGGEDDALQQVTETHERRGYEGDAHDDREVAILRRLPGDRKSTRLNSSHSQISYAVFCLKKKKTKNNGRLV